MEMESSARKRQISDRSLEDSDDQNSKRSRETVTEFHPVPEQFVQSLIEGISSLQTQSSCEIRVPEYESVPGFRLVEIIGFPENIETARKLIGNVVSNGNLQEITEEVMVPQSIAGMVIGKSRCRINELGAETNTHISASKRKSVNGFSPVFVTGTLENVARAKAKISEMLSEIAKVEDEKLTTFSMPIPFNYCGALIGKSGEQIKRLQNSTNCQINLLQDVNGFGTQTARPLQIVGTAANVLLAKRQIEELLAQFEQSFGKQESLTPENPYKKEKEKRVTEHLMVPADACGMIIGKGGSFMKKLKAWTNCQMRLIQHSGEGNVTDEEKALVISGKYEDVQKAKEIVLATLAEKYAADRTKCFPGNDSQATKTVHVKIPSTAVGALIGLGGATIRQLADDTKCKIQFLEYNTNSLERELVIFGTETMVQVALKMIKEIVEATKTEKDSADVIFYMTIPSSKCGLVIGKGGSTIKFINRKSGAFCQLLKDEAEQSVMEKTIIIKGTEQQVEHAKHLLRIQVGDINPTIPFGGVAQPTLPTVISPAIAALALGLNPIFFPAFPTVQPIIPVDYIYPGANVLQEQQSTSLMNFGYPGATVTQTGQPTISGNLNYLGSTVTRPEQSTSSGSYGYPGATVMKAGQPTSSVNPNYPGAPAIKTEHSGATVTPASSEEEAPKDYSSQWLEYYMKIGDMENYEAVKAQIQEEREEREALERIRRLKDS